MEFDTRQDYPAGLDRLWTVFGQPDYPRRKYLALGATAVHLHRFDATASAIEVDLERVVPLAGSRLPGWARRLLGSEQTIRHRTSWRRTGVAQVAAELDIVPVGLPVRAHGVGAITEPARGKARMTLVWHVESSLPLMRGRLERLFAEQVRDALAADHDFTLRYLQGGASDAGRERAGVTRR